MGGVDVSGMKRWLRLPNMSVYGQECSVEVKRLSWTEAYDFNRWAAPLIGGSGRAADTADTDPAAAEAQASKLFDEIAAKRDQISYMYEHYVRRVRGLTLEADGEDEPDIEIKTGAQLGEVAPLDMTITLLTMIGMLTRGLNVGKAQTRSGSPSPSPSDQPDGASTATPAEGVDGTAPETAPETQSAEPSSGPVGE